MKIKIFELGLCHVTDAKKGFVYKGFESQFQDVARLLYPTTPDFGVLMRDMRLTNSQKQQTLLLLEKYIYVY